MTMQHNLVEASTMDMATAALIGNVANAIIKIGVPAVHDLVDKLGSKPNPTSEDFEALVHEMKDAETYFEKTDTEEPDSG